jgi:hypothetical protein
LTKPPSDGNGDRYVSYRQFVCWVIAMSGTMLTLLWIGWQIHISSTHPGGVRMDHFNAVMDLLREQISLIRIDIRDIKTEVKK